MALYLRDEQISNLTITKECLKELLKVLGARQTSMPEHVVGVASHTTRSHLHHTIRFDQKGYRAFADQQLLLWFDQAKTVERIICLLESDDSLKSNRNFGSYIDLRLDNNPNTPCFLTVSSDDEDWVDASFSAIRDVLQRYKNKHILIRNSWTELLIQILGLFLGFIFSLWGGSKIAPFLKIENPFLISFLLVLLVFSNLWTPINIATRGAIYKLFPVIKFYRPNKDNFTWLIQAAVSAILGAAVLYLIGIGFTYVGKMLNDFIINTPR